MSNWSEIAEGSTAWTGSQIYTEDSYNQQDRDCIIFN